MREIRPSGSEGGARSHSSFLPLSIESCSGISWESRSVILHPLIPEMPDRRCSRPPLVRLRLSVHRRVEVPLWRSFPPVTESNCVVATRGGEQLEVNG